MVMDKVYAEAQVLAISCGWHITSLRLSNVLRLMALN